MKKGINITSIRSNHGREHENENFQKFCKGNGILHNIFAPRTHQQTILVLKKTPYKLWKGRKPNISYFHLFGCECFILNTMNNLGKFNPKVYNSTTLTMEKTIHIKFNDSKLDKEANRVKTRSNFKNQEQVTLLLEIELGYIYEAYIAR
ncbi:hypothetical protein CR513_01730, partial [Mucuna pruriens]